MIWETLLHFVRVVTKTQPFPVVIFKGALAVPPRNNYRGSSTFSLRRKFKLLTRTSSMVKRIGIIMFRTSAICPPKLVAVNFSDSQVVNTSVSLSNDCRSFSGFPRAFKRAIERQTDRAGNIVKSTPHF